MRFCSVVLLICFFAVSICAQSTTVTLVGTVRDANQLPMAGVSVTVVEISTNSSRKTTTDDSGGYSLSGLSPGRYRVDFSREQFKTKQAVVELRLNETRRVDVPMELGLITEVVEVRSTSPLLQTDTSAVGISLGQQQIQESPNPGRQI